MKRSLVIAAALGLSVLACEQKPSENAAPTSSALEPAKPKSAESSAFEVDTASSKATFLMDAPIEKIHGEANQSVTGELFVDLVDITKSNGLVKIDLDKLEIFQQTRKTEDDEFGERTKVDKQNEHAKTWLEISPDAPDDVREKNRYVEFKIKSVESATKSVAEMKGDERKVTMTVKGDLRLHQRTAEKTVELEATFKYDGEKPVSVAIKSTKPIPVGLEEHDVRPRSAFDTLAKSTLSALGQKVAEAAPIEIEFMAKAKAAAGGGAKEEKKEEKKEEGY